MPEPKVAQKFPYVQEMEPGKYAWCACGHSAKQPFCDGSHARQQTGMTPIVFEVKEKGKIAWCGCKHSAKKPQCDGTHRTLPQ